MFKSFLKFNTPPSSPYGLLAGRTFSLVFTHSWCPLSLFVLVHLTIFQARYLLSHPTHDTNDVKPTVDNIYLGVLPSGGNVSVHAQTAQTLVDFFTITIHKEIWGLLRSEETLSLSLFHKFHLWFTCSEYWLRYRYMHQNPTFMNVLQLGSQE